MSEENDVDQLPTDIISAVQLQSCNNNNVVLKNESISLLRSVSKTWSAVANGQVKRLDAHTPPWRGSRFNDLEVVTFTTGWGPTLNQLNGFQSRRLHTLSLDATMLSAAGTPSCCAMWQ